MGTTLLIDGDVFVYQHTTAVETPIHWGDDFWTLHADAGVAKAQLDIQLHIIKSELQATDVLIAFSDSLNFRHSVLPSYKSNRKKRKPVAYKAVRDYCRHTYKCLTLPTLEADDTLGILATGGCLYGLSGDRVVVTVDKDLKSVPCNLFNPQHPEDGVVAISEQEADRNHLTQSLMGDTTDGYSGCPGIGAKRAERILDADPTWAAVLNAYEKAGLSEDEALKQARVARICRQSDYDIENKKVKLWQP